MLDTGRKYRIDWPEQVDHGRTVTALGQQGEASTRVLFDDGRRACFADHRLIAQAKPQVVVGRRYEITPVYGRHPHQGRTGVATLELSGDQWVLVLDDLGRPSGCSCGQADQCERSSVSLYDLTEVDPALPSGYVVFEHADSFDVRTVFPDSVVHTATTRRGAQDYLTALTGVDVTLVPHPEVFNGWTVRARN